MRMHRVVACLALLVGCGPRVDEETPDFNEPQTIEDSCESWCMTAHACCDPLGGSECSPWQLTEGECLAECIAAESDFSFNEECRDDYYANVACASELTCEEYVDYYKGEAGHECEAEKDARSEMLNKGCFGT